MMPVVLWFLVAIVCFVASAVWAVIADGEPGARFPAAVSAFYALAGAGSVALAVLTWAAA